MRDLLVGLTGGVPGGDGYGRDGARTARRSVAPCFGLEGETMTMIGYTTGLSALTASQEAINIAGQNIANANTPGYHRQTVDLTAAQPTPEDNLLIGTGVDVADITAPAVNCSKTPLTPTLRRPPLQRRNSAYCSRFSPSSPPVPVL